MDLSEVKAKINNREAILLDVREEDEWKESHLDSAQLYPLSQLEQGIPDDLPDDKTIYIHCRRGGRAQQAAQLLQSRYPNVVALKCDYEVLQTALER